ncbi:MAG: cold-shock protein [Chitinispirillaceae bacterium]
MPDGRVLWFDDIKGVGRIRADRDGSLLKVKHSSVLRQGYKVLDEGQRVSFTVVRCRDGLEACSVTLLDN